MVSFSSGRLSAMSRVNSYCIFCTNCRLFESPRAKDIAQMLGNDRAFTAEELRHLLLRQPDGFVVKFDLQACCAVLGSVEEDVLFQFRGHHLVTHHA